MQGMKI